MPYVDEGEPKPRSELPPLIAIGAVVLASCATPLLWYFCHNWFGYSYAGALLAALAIGLAAKFTLTRHYPPLKVVAIVLLVLGSFAGFVWIDSTIWTPFMFGKTVERFSKDIVALLFIGFGAYLVFILANPRLAVVQRQYPQD
jgi:drug/metabolite transporter (DMT)-like permease